MDEMQRRLRAALTAAAEEAPPGLMDAIRRRHRRHIRRVGVGCAAIAVAVAAVSPAVVHALTTAPARIGHVFPGHAGTPSPSAVPGTMLFTCSDATWGKLPSNWRARSLRVGPLWFVYGRQFGSVHHGGSTTRRGVNGHGKVRDGVMIVEVTDGSTVTMKSEPADRPFFRLVAGFNGRSPNSLPRGDTGFTFVACPRGRAGPNGRVTDFYLGFLIKAGSVAPVDVRTPGQQEASRVIFTCPGRGCEGSPAGPARTPTPARPGAHRTAALLRALRRGL